MQSKIIRFESKCLEAEPVGIDQSKFRWFLRTGIGK